MSALFSAGKESPDGQQQESIVLADGEAVENDHKKPGIEVLYTMLLQHH